MEAPEPGRLIVAITGASGAIYGIRALLHLSRLAHVETHLVVTAAARRTIAQEAQQNGHLQVQIRASVL